MCMSVMERRLQLLLDQERYDRVEQEARRSGRSVAAVIREAIDVRFESDFSIRAEAIRSLLEETREPVGVEPDWSESKELMDRELDEKLAT
jgi:predicted DNA-binding protein